MVVAPHLPLPSLIRGFLKQILFISRQCIVVLPNLGHSPLASAKPILGSDRLVLRLSALSLHRHQLSLFSLAEHVPHDMGHSSHTIFRESVFTSRLWNWIEFLVYPWSLVLVKIQPPHQRYLSHAHNSNQKPRRCHPPWQITHTIPYFRSCSPSSAISLQALRAT